MELKLSNYKQNVKEIKLLIVPYGIETTNPSASEKNISTFNRTLWN